MRLNCCGIVFNLNPRQGVAQRDVAGGSSSRSSSGSTSPVLAPLPASLSASSAGSSIRTRSSLRNATTTGPVRQGESSTAHQVTASPDQIDFARKAIGTRIARIHDLATEGRMDLLSAIAARPTEIPELVFPSISDLIAYLRLDCDRPPFIVATVGSVHAFELSIRTTTELNLPTRTSLVIYNSTDFLPGESELYDVPERRRNDADLLVEQNSLQALMLGIKGDACTVLLIGAQTQRDKKKGCRPTALHALRLDAAESSSVHRLHEQLLAGQHPAFCNDIGQGFFTVSGIAASSLLSARHYKYLQAKPLRRRGLVEYQSRHDSDWLESSMNKRGESAQSAIVQGPRTKGLDEKTARHIGRSLEYLHGLQAQGDAGASIWFSALRRLQPGVDVDGSVQPLSWIFTRQVEKLRSVQSGLESTQARDRASLVVELAGHVGSFLPSTSIRAAKLLSHHIDAADSWSDRGRAVVASLMDEGALTNAARATDLPEYLALLALALGRLEPVHVLQQLQQAAPDTVFDVLLRCTRPLHRDWTDAVATFIDRHVERFSPVQKLWAVEQMDIQASRVDTPVRLSLLDKLADSPDLAESARFKALQLLAHAASEIDDPTWEDRIAELGTAANDRCRPIFANWSTDEQARLNSVTRVLTDALESIGMPGCNATGLVRFFKQHGFERPTNGFVDVLAMATHGKVLSHEDAQALAHDVGPGRDVEQSDYLLVELPVAPYFAGLCRASAGNLWSFDGWDQLGKPLATVLAQLPFNARQPLHVIHYPGKNGIELHPLTEDYAA